MAEVGKPNSGTNLRIQVYDARAEGLETGALEGLRAILAYMRAVRFIRDWKLDTEDYDRPSWDDGFQIELQASVFEPGACVRVYRHVCLSEGWVGGAAMCLLTAAAQQPFTSKHSDAGGQHAVHGRGLPLPS